MDKDSRALVAPGLLCLAAFAATNVAPDALASALLYDAAVASCAAACWIGARRQGSAQGRPWRYLALALACFTAGNVVWDVYEHALQIDAPFPSAADVAYLAAYPLIALSLSSLLALRSAVDRVNVIFDSAVIAMAMSLLTWEPLLIGVGGDVLGAVVAGAYPVCDVALLGAALVFAVSERGRAASVVLVAGLVSLLVGDLGYLVLEQSDAYATGAWPDAFFLLGPLLLAAAPNLSWSEAKPAQRPAPTVVSVLVVLLALIALPVDFGLGSSGASRPSEVPVRVGLRLVLLGVVGARLLRQATTNQWLARTANDSANRLSMVMSHTADAVIFTAPDGTVLEWNRAAERLFRIRREEIVGTQALDHFGGPHATSIGRAVQSGSLFTEMTVAIEIGRRTVPVSFQVERVWDDEERLLGYVTVAHDDTRRYVARQAQLTMATLDPERAVLRFAQELGGFVPFRTLALAWVEADEFRELARVRRANENEGFEIADKDRLRTGTLQDFGLNDADASFTVLTRADPELEIAGGPESRSGIVLPLHAPGGRLCGILSLGFEDPTHASIAYADALARVAPDIAQSVENMVLFERGQLVADRLVEMNAKRDTFVAMVAHEVRGPLSAINNAASVLSERAETMNPTRAQRMLDGITSSAEQLSRLTNDLVDAGRDGEGRFPCCMTHVPDVGAVVIAATRRGAGGRADRVHVEVAANVNVVGDPQRIGQIVTNLVENALKYSDGDVAVRLTDDQDMIRLSVADYGPGIPADQAHLLFERYARLGRSDEEFPGGSGLGLFISRELARAHGGDIRHRPTPGGGATFELTLPSASAEAHAYSAASTAPANSHSF